MAITNDILLFPSSSDLCLFFPQNQNQKREGGAPLAVPPEYAPAGTFDKYPVDKLA